MEVTSDGAGSTYKRARSDDERRRIEREAAVLRRVAHPGVVQLLATEGADPPDALVLRTVSGGDLTALGAQPLPVIAGLGAALATTVADLQALGFSHGSIEASHVLLDEAGRPVLCSLGRSEATATAPGAERRHDEDLRALASMLLELLPPDGSVRVARTLRALATPTRRRLRRDASWLARWLISTVPDARLPGPEGARASPSGGVDHQARSSCPLWRTGPVPPARRVAIGVGLCLLIACAAVLVGWGASSDRSRAQARGESAAPCPVVDEGCVPIGGDGRVLVEPMGRYVVGQPGDLVVVGRWGCRPAAFPAVLRPATGDVWIFDTWPAPGDPVVGRLVARVGSASSLRVLPGPSGCDRLEVARSDLPPVTIVGAPQ
jgi:hypothetical protein